MQRKEKLMYRQAGLLLVGERLDAAGDQDVDLDKLRVAVSKKVDDVREKVLADDIARVD